ncbi:MAG: glycosyltransferase family 2 protein [Verrucomicrobiota bacterium]
MSVTATFPTTASGLVVAGSYREWVARFDTIGARERFHIRRQIRFLRRHPIISIVLPVYNPDPEHLRAAIASVQGQLYQNWELCLADDASTDSNVKELLAAIADTDERIKVVFREMNGHIAACSNSALALSTGEWMGLLDQDDFLPEHALALVAAAINERPDAGLIYSDEDKVDEDGQRCRPFFKPDWNPELFLGQNFVSHLGVYRTALVRESGGFRERLDGAQDYDLALRVIERLQPDQILHLPRVLYHWRMCAGSVAHDPTAKPYAPEAARRALTEHLVRKQIGGAVTPCPENEHWYRVSYELPGELPLVSAIIPTRDHAELLRRFIVSLRQITDYPRLELIIVDNGSEEEDAVAYLQQLGEEANVRIVSAPGEFNFSRLVNIGATQALGEIIAVLNNDLEVTEADWLREMVSHLLRDGVGVVGARLWFPDGTLQHAGVIPGMAGVAAHAFYRFPPYPIARGNRTFALAQNYSAVTAACMLVRSAVYREVGGFDEALPRNFNDVDFCLRVRERGWQIVWTPYANLIHHESASRRQPTGRMQHELNAELEWMVARWGETLLFDPFYSPNLSLTLPGYEPAFPPRLPGLDGSTLTAGEFVHAGISESRASN